MVSTTVSIYGFWDDFGKKDVPREKPIYFVLAGIVVAEAICKLVRTVYIGKGVSAQKKLFDDGEGMNNLKACLGAGERLFYAVGDTANNNIDVAHAALCRRLNPQVSSGDESPIEEGVEVSLEGKIPGLYLDSVSFKVEPVVEGGAS